MQAYPLMIENVNFDSPNIPIDIALHPLRSASKYLISHGTGRYMQSPGFVENPTGALKHVDCQPSMPPFSIQAVYDPHHVYARMPTSSLLNNISVSIVS